MSLEGVVRFTVVGILAAIGSPYAHASVIANAQIGLTRLQIIPSAGTVIFLSPWMAEAFAQAQNSLGELDQNFDGPGNTASATGMVTFVNASGAANASLLMAGASSFLHITGDAAASGTGRGTLTSMFEITGGSGAVNVQYMADVTRMLALSTDAYGQLAGGEVIFTLTRDGVVVLFSDDIRSIGPSSMFNSSNSGTQSQTETLQYNTPYLLLLELDAESQGTNVTPEPATLWLILGPLGLTFVVRHLRIIRRISGRR